MVNSQMPTGSRLAASFLQPALYPLQRRFLIWAVSAGLISGLVFLSPLIGLSFFVLFVILGALWRIEEPPILVFCLSFQWLFVVTGYYYQLFTGDFPGGLPGDLEGAVLLSLLGLLIIVLGVRLGLKLLEARLLLRRGKVEPKVHVYHIGRLFWYVIIAYSISWVVKVGPTEFAFDVAGFISHAVAFRGVLLCLLFLAVLRQRTGYRYAAIAGVFVFLPEATSMFAAWSGVFFLLFILLMGEWKPWSGSVADRRRNTRLASTLTGVTACLFVMALIWQGGVKSNWRWALATGAAEAGPTEKLKILGSITEDVLSQLDWSQAWESLAERLSGAYYFSHVLLHVPGIVPYENGELTMRALEHTFKPRFLFPDKPDLGSNSWLIREYAGFYPAGDESGTSIGLTYMAEFYIDFGRVGMFVPLFLWGILIGLAYGALFLLSPSHEFACAAVAVMFPQPFASFEGEIAYLLAGLLQVFIVFGLLLFLFGPVFHRKLLNSGLTSPFAEKVAWRLREG